MSHYFDHAATHPMPPQVLNAYVDALKVTGNPASIHAHGQHAKMLLEESREVLSAGLSADPVELVFTSGGTESINTAIKGLFWQRQLNGPKPVIVLPDGEHHATFEAVEWLAKHSKAIPVWLPIDNLGRINPADLAAALAENSDQVALVTALWANNEVGTIQPVHLLAEITESYAVPFHLDAVAAYGYLPVGLSHPGITAVSVTSHKIGGPAGIGGLAIRRQAKLEPLLHGGSHERRLRSGSQSPAASHAFAESFRQTKGWDLAALQQLRDSLVAKVSAEIPDVIIGGDPDPSGRLPGNAHFIFCDADGDAMLFLLDQQGLSVSTGSACQAGVPEVSHVLLAMGYPEKLARGALRITLGIENTEAEIDKLANAIVTSYRIARLAR